MKKLLEMCFERFLIGVYLVIGINILEKNKRSIQAPTFL